MYKAIGMIVLQSLFYSILDPFAKIVYQELPTVIFLWVRYVLATLLMLAIWHKQIWQEIQAVPVKKYILPVVCMSLTYILSNIAFKYTNVANVAFVRSSTAILAALLLVVFFHKKFTLVNGVSLALMVLGMYLLCSQRGSGLSGFGIGEIYTLLGALLVAIALVWGSETLHYMSAVTLSCLQLFGSIWFCGFMGLVDGSWATTDWQLFLQPKVFLTLLYAIVFCSIAGYLLQNWALKYISSKLVGMVQCAYPLFAAGVSYIVLGEKLGLVGILGGLMIICSVLLESSAKK